MGKAYGLILTTVIPGKVCEIDNQFHIDTEMPHFYNVFPGPSNIGKGKTRPTGRKYLGI